MTDQIRDTIAIKDKDYFFLESILPEKLVAKNSFYSPHSALRKGYTLKSVLLKNRLYIIEFSGFIAGNNSSPLNLQKFFNTNNDKLFADWFTGTIFCSDGFPFFNAVNILALTFRNGKLVLNEKIAMKKWEDQTRLNKIEKSYKEILNYADLSDDTVFYYNSLLLLSGEYPEAAFDWDPLKNFYYFGRYEIMLEEKRYSIEIKRKLDMQIKTDRFKDFLRRKNLLHLLEL